MENNMADNENELLSVKNLTVEYSSDRRVIHAVNNVSFKVKRGQTLGLVGETGAGKTTIAKSILRILPDPPAKIKEGGIVFNGKDITKMEDTELHKIRGAKISMVFQDPMTALNPTMRVGSQIMDGIKLHSGLDNHEAEQKALEIFEMVGISPDRFWEYPYQFSGGMKQRVVIAIALSCSPELLLADEPTTALDVTIQAQVLELINKLKTERNTSVLLITHDLGVVAETCDDVAVVYAGEIVEMGSLEEIFEHPIHPYTLGLFNSLPNMSQFRGPYHEHDHYHRKEGQVPRARRSRRRLHPIAGMMPDPSQLPEGCKFHPRCPYADECCRSGIIEMVAFEGTHECRCCNREAAVAEEEE
jgi:peptide/nickel transport system ATP-binding protein